MRTRVLKPPTGTLRLPARVFNRTAAHCALALAALVVGLEPLFVRSLGTRAPAWSHWWCSAASASGGSHAASSGWLGGGSHATGSGSLGEALHTTLAVLAVHWPHFLPILLALGTLVYLWRADAQHRAERQRCAVFRPLPTDDARRYGGRPSPLPPI